MRRLIFTDGGSVHLDVTPIVPAQPTPTSSSIIDESPISFTVSHHASTKIVIGATLVDHAVRLQNFDFYSVNNDRFVFNVVADGRVSKNWT